MVSIKKRIKEFLFNFFKEELEEAFKGRLNPPEKPIPHECYEMVEISREFDWSPPEINSPRDIKGVQELEAYIYESIEQRKRDMCLEAMKFIETITAVYVSHDLRPNKKIKLSLFVGKQNIPR